MAKTERAQLAMISLYNKKKNLKKEEKMKNKNPHKKQHK